MEKEYTISACDNKSADWKVITLEIVEGEGSVMYENVSVNRVNKKGETFPNFDNIIVGQRVKGNLWTSPQGKHYLYAPRPQTNAGGANRGQSGGFKANMEKMVEKKQEGIRQSQENKELGIKISSTIRLAHETALREIEGAPFDEGVFKSVVKKWREWYWLNWEAKDEDYPPFE